MVYHQPDEPELVCQSLPELVSLFCISHLLKITFFSASSPVCDCVRQKGRPWTAHGWRYLGFSGKSSPRSNTTISPVIIFFLPVHIPHLWWLNLNSIPNSHDFMMVIHVYIRFQPPFLIIFRESSFESQLRTVIFDLAW